MQTRYFGGHSYHLLDLISLRMSLISGYSPLNPISCRSSVPVTGRTIKIVTYGESEFSQFRVHRCCYKRWNTIYADLCLRAVKAGLYCSMLYKHKYRNPLHWVDFRYATFMRQKDRYVGQQS